MARMSIRQGWQELRDATSAFKDRGKRLGIIVATGNDSVTVGRASGQFSGSHAEVTAGASRGTLTRSALQAGWQKRGEVGITIITPDGVELYASAKDEKAARRFAAEYNTRSGAHKEK